MDVNDLVGLLNRVLALGDSIDSSGVIGVKAITRGKYTLREVFRLELCQFLLYVADGNNFLDDSEVALLNIAMDSMYDASQWHQVASEMQAPNPNNNMTLMGFLTIDVALTKQNGYRTHSATDALIRLYKTFGDLMVAFDDNPASKARCAKYVNRMKTYVMKTF